MNINPTDLTGLLGSRMCHDLISPLGAIGNGVELLELSGVEGPEITLIQEAVASANQRIRFFRVAFGAATETQVIAADEIARVLGAADAGRNVVVDWQPDGDLPRAQVKRAFLALLCMETALPYGGRIRVSNNDGHWQITATGERLKIDPDLWHLVKHGADALPAAAHLHFVLLGLLLAETGLEPILRFEDSEISLTF